MLPRLRWPLTLLVVFTACEAPDDHKRSIDLRDTSTQCSAVRACDVTETDCQTAILELTACLRGDEAPVLPEIRTLTSQELAAELRDAADAAGDEPSPVDAALRALSLLSSDVSATDASIDAVTDLWIAYYDSDTKRVSLIDSNEPLDPTDAMFTLSHEFTHYLQDQHTDLNTLIEDAGQGSDGQIAARTLLEGEALVTSVRALARFAGRSVGAIDWERLYGLLDVDLLEGISESSSPLARAGLALPYAVGARYVGTVWNHYDREHVDALFDDAPRTVADWMAGYGDGVVADSLHQDLACGPPLPPDGYSVWALDYLGSTGALALLGAAGAADLELAARLRADAIAVYAPRDAHDGDQGPALAVWRLRFSDAKTAASFASAIAPLQLTTELFDQELVLSAAQSTEPLQGDDLRSCPSLEDLKPLHEASQPVAARAFR